MTAMTSTAAATILARASWRDLASAYRLAKRYSPALAALILTESRSRIFTHGLKAATMGV